MSRRKRPQPEHGSPHEQHLRDIVDELVQEESQKAAYLAFAHELAAVQRRAYTVHRVIPTKRSAGRNLAARQTGRDPSIGVGVTKGRDPSFLLGMTDGRDPSISCGCATPSASLRAGSGTSGVTKGRDPSFLLGMTDGRDPSIGVGVTGMTMRQRRSPDFSIRTKRVIAKWVARGLTQSVLQAIRTDVFNVAAPVAP